MQESEFPTTQHHIPHSYTSPTHPNIKTLFSTTPRVPIFSSNTTTQLKTQQLSTHISLTQNPRSQGARSTRSFPPSSPYSAGTTARIKEKERYLRDRETRKRKGNKHEEIPLIPYPNFSSKGGETREKSVCVCVLEGKRRE